MEGPNSNDLEPIETHLRRVEASAELLFWRCPHCKVTREVLEVSGAGGIPRAVGITHEPGCPDDVDEPLPVPISMEVVRRGSAGYPETVGGRE